MQLSGKLPTTCFELSLLIAQYRSAEIYQLFKDINEQLSMLHPDVLAMLYHYGAHSNGQILELGPYVGGSTVAIARGAGDANNPAKITSIELGQTYRHPTYVTDDIAESLRANLKSHGVAEQVNLIIGSSRDQSVLQSISTVFENNGPFGFLVIDADGQVEKDISLYRRFLAPQCYLVVDDYYSPGAPDKEATTSSQLDTLEDQRVVESFGVHGWGTWFGRFV